MTTRRAFKQHESGLYECRYVKGRTYAVQTKWMGAGVARIKILGVRFYEKVREINEEDARAEGFESAEMFLSLYKKMYGERSLDRPCFRIRFRLES